jgi:hypothetical protein
MVGSLSLPSLLGCETFFATGRAALEPEPLEMEMEMEMEFNST